MNRWNYLAVAIIGLSAAADVASGGSGTLNMSLCRNPLLAVGLVVLHPDDVRWIIKTRLSGGGGDDG